MSSAHTVLTIAIIAAVFYPLFMRFLLDKAQPMRLKLADLGNELLDLDDEKLPERDKRAIAQMMSDAFDWRFMIKAFLKAPAFAWRKAHGKLQRDPLSKISDAATREKARTLAGYFVWSAAAANPFVFFAVCIEIVVFTYLLRAIKALNDDTVKEATRRVFVRTEYAAADHAAA